MRWNTACPHCAAPVHYFVRRCPACHGVIVRRARPLVQFALGFAGGAWIGWSRQSAERGLLAGLALGTVSAVWEFFEQRDRNPPPEPTPRSHARGTMWLLGLFALGFAAMFVRPSLLRGLVWLAHPSSRAATPYVAPRESVPIRFEGGGVAFVDQSAIYVGSPAMQAEWSRVQMKLKPGVHPIRDVFGDDHRIALRVRALSAPPRLQVVDRDRAWAEFDVGTGELRALVGWWWLDLAILGAFGLVATIVGRRVMFHRPPFTFVGVLVGASVAVAGIYAVAYLGA